MDATTGELLGYYDRLPQPDGAMTFGSEPPVKAAFLPLTEDEAIRLARQLLELGELADLQAINEGPGDYVTVLWNDEFGGADIAFDRATGLIRHAWRSTGEKGYRSMKELEEQVRRPDAQQLEQAREKAMAFVRKYYSPILSQSVLQPVTRPWGPPDSANLYLQRYVNDVPVLTDHIDINFDPISGKWQSISFNWTEGAYFPPVEAAVSPAEAEAAFWNQAELRLVYQFREMWDAEPYPYPEKEHGPRIRKAIPVYELLTDSYEIDALTGSLTGYDGEPVGTLAKAQATIRGHWAEGALNHLLQRQVLEPAQLNPNAPVTRLQAVHMVLVRQPGPGYFGPEYLEKLPYADIPDTDRTRFIMTWAGQEGWLEPSDSKQFRPDEAITRGQFAVWLARAIQLGDLARSELQVVPKYTDLAGLSQEEQNAVSFLRALGMLKPAEAFRGGDTLTQAEGAVLVARVSNYLADQR